MDADTRGKGLTTEDYLAIDDRVVARIRELVFCLESSEPIKVWPRRPGCQRECWAGCFVPSPPHGVKTSVTRH